MRLDPELLYTVQRTALERSYGLGGFAFFMEMGLGKTRTVLYEFNWLCEDREAEVLVILCPRSLRGTWRREVADIGLDYPVWYIGKNARQDAEVFKEMQKHRGPKVVVIHYELVLGRGGEFIGKLMEKWKLYVALDESTRIKKHDSKVGKWVYKNLTVPMLGDEAVFIRVLSGRPAPQGPHDLWGQFKVIGAVEKRPYYAFRNLYCRMGGWQAKQVIGAQNLDHLRNETGPWVFRAKKSEWTDLPEKLPPVIRDAPMLPEQREAYLAMMHEFVVEMGERPITVEMAVTAKAKLAQISSGFLFDNEKNVHWLVPFEKNPKLLDLDEYDEEVESKVIVFYHHRPTLEALRWWAERKSNQFKCAFLAGGMKDEEIDEQKRLFNEEDDYKYIFCQSSAHKYGHTLLGTAKVPCHNSYFFENTYSLETRVQSEDRNHRHGQKYPVGYADVTTCREDRLTIKALQRKDGFEVALLDMFRNEIAAFQQGKALIDDEVPY